ncbi:hypothetical protein LIER_28746 [Lithospermum erythrorhizon]|uniref:Uncharacterized protein n=1 Tax=Lithospermum erythrorhizon TaxID=34254 RepID=A0AAV3RK20_LITER
MLLEKLKSVKVGMSQLNKLAFSNISARVQLCVQKLEGVQDKLFQGSVTQEVLIEEKNLRSELDRLVFAYKNKMKISILEDEQGNSISEPVEVERVVIEFYKDLFKPRVLRMGSKRNISNHSSIDVYP